MIRFSTLTQKGQIVIPQEIREALRLKPASRVAVELQNDAILVRPAPSIADVFGMVKTKKRITKKEWKKAVRDAVVEKYRKKLAISS